MTPTALVTKAASATAAATATKRNCVTETPRDDAPPSPRSSSDSGRISRPETTATAPSFGSSDSGISQLCCDNEPAPQMNRLTR